MFESPEEMIFLNVERGLAVWAEPSEKLPSLVAEIHIGKGRHCAWSREAQIETYRGIIRTCNRAIRALAEAEEDGET